jgi:hypothetical protein
MAINVAGYPRLTGETDDTARIRRAIAAWLTSTDGCLNFGSGVYQVSSEIRIERPNVGAIFGTVRGDGPGVCQIKGVPNKRTLTVVNFNEGIIEGIGFSGGPSPRPAMNWTYGQDHVGLTLGNIGGGVSHGAHLRNVRFENYAVGLSLGDWHTAGAAAEWSIQNVGAARCHIGIGGFGFNTLNNSFFNTELGECVFGVYSDSAYGWNFYGGSLGNNYHSFHLMCGGEVIVEGMRDEYGPLTDAAGGGFITYGASTSIRLLVRGCQVLDQEPFRTNRWYPVSIRPTNGQTSLILEGSTIAGRAEATKYLAIRGSSFIVQNNGPIFTTTPTVREIGGNVYLDKFSGQTIADVPNQSTLVGPQGVAGPQGPAGPTGAAGPQGPQGEPGPSVGALQMRPAATRLVDTRFGQGGIMLANQPRTFTLAGVEDIPAEASAVLVNVTVAGNVADGYVRAHPTDATGGTSVINFDRDLAAIANMVVLKVASGSASFMASVDTHLILDAHGWVT